MQKLRLKKINQNRTSIETDMLLYLSKHQDKYGRIIGLHYAEVAAELNIAIKSFYDILERLQEKGDITVYSTDNSRAWRWYQGINIVINDNDYSRGNYEQNRYLNTNLDFLYQKKFRHLTAKEKQLVLNLLAIKDIREGKEKKFKVDTLMRYCDITNKYLLAKYLENINGLLNIMELGGLIAISLTRESIKAKTAATETYIINRLRTYCRQYKISYIYKELKDIYTLFTQYGELFRNKVINNLIDTSLKYGTLEPSLINHLINN
jgi:hypothetical protein